jgi:hypothetical protein
MMIRHEGVARVLAPRYRGDHEALGQVDRDILHGVHREVGATVHQRLLELLHEQPLAANARQGGTQPAVAFRGHPQQGDLQSGMGCLEAVADVFGLPEGKSAFTGCDDEFSGGRGHGRQDSKE